MNSRDLIAEYAELLNEHGVDSQEANDFLDAHRFNEEFYELASLTRKLKVALTRPTCEQHICN